MHEDLTPVSALVGEIVGTFLLMYVVLETAVSPRSLANGMKHIIKHICYYYSKHTRKYPRHLVLLIQC